MPTWALALLLLAITTGMWVVALAYTHPVEQENPWPPNDATSTDAPEK